MNKKIQKQAHRASKEQIRQIYAEIASGAIEDLPSLAAEDLEQFFQTENIYLWENSVLTVSEVPAWVNRTVEEIIELDEIVTHFLVLAVFSEYDLSIERVIEIGGQAERILEIWSATNYVLLTGYTKEMKVGEVIMRVLVLME